ncbi:MAG: hypothetical protein WBD32_21225, partial [Acidobacteriaceae bacterium]
MARRLPLTTLLSFALVAFTIEFDNEAEHRQPYRTSDHGGPASAPWLVSMAMFLNCLQFVSAQGTAQRELERQARTRTNWDGMRRWGYIYLEPDPGDPRPRPPQSAWLVRPTVKGRIIQESMRALLPEIEERWRTRFGDLTVRNLRKALTAMLRMLPEGLPDCMPILHYGLVTEGPEPEMRGRSPQESELENLPLPVLLARILLTLALEFEEESPLSLAICANILRVLESEGTLVARVPAMSGVSKEAVAMAVGFLQRHGYGQVLSQMPAKRGRIVLLNSTGTQVQTEYPQRLGFQEERWKARIGADALANL